MPASPNQQATGAAEALSELVFLQTEIAQLRAELRTDIASLKITIAHWIVGAMFVNVLTMIGAVAAVRQLAGHRP
jgi:hypothetical protein